MLLSHAPALLKALKVAFGEGAPRQAVAAATGVEAAVTAAPLPPRRSHPPPRRSPPPAQRHHQRRPRDSPAVEYAGERLPQC